MSRYLNQDVLAGIAFTAGGAFGLLADDLPVGSTSQMGPGFFPYAVSWGLLLVGAATLITGLVKHTPVERLYWKPLVLITVPVATFGFLIDTAGLLVSAGIMLIMAMYAGREFKLYEAIAVALVLIVASSLIFVVGFGLPVSLLPRL